jgi:acylphosphatase
VERREAYYSGHVQGVGFRYTARQIAARFPLSGYVQNLADGRVFLVAEGSAEALSGYLAALSAELDRYIAAAEVAVEPATNEFDGFGIRF